MAFDVQNVLAKDGEDDMPKRWSKLQKRLYNIIDSAAEFQIHCALYEMNSNDGYHGNKLPRYWITIGKEIVFDYPKDFDTSWKYGKTSYPWDTEISEITELINEYIQTPKKKIMQPFENDKWGLTDILRACDRRIGKRTLKQMKDNIDNDKIILIIDKRMGINLFDE